MATTVLLFIFSLAFTCTLTMSETDSQDPMDQALRSLQNEDEKSDFLKFHLLRGLIDWAETQPRPPKFIPVKSDNNLLKALNISDEVAEKLQSLDIPKESSRKLLDWTKSEFNLTTRDILELVRSRRCYRPPCLPDIGELCCPW